MTDRGTGNTTFDEHGHRVTGQIWRWTALAGMASYLDAGSIVALGSGLALWQEYLGLNNSAVGALAAIGPNAIGAAIGAFVGGRLGDLLGRKRIYQYDLLVYAFGILLIAFAVNSPMLFIGTVIVGIAVGADVPTSRQAPGLYSDRLEPGPDHRPDRGVRACAAGAVGHPDRLRSPVRICPRDLVPA
jgi:MFS transporter, SP family, inositol transporter